MSKISRRDFVKMAGVATAGVALYNFGGESVGAQTSGEKSKV